MVYEQAFSVRSPLGSSAHTLAILLVKHLSILFQAYTIVPLKFIVLPMLPAQLLSTALG
jgi:hypothetical protein